MNERNGSSVLDEYLVIQSQLGDADAFSRLAGRWHPRICRHALRFTHNADASRDVAQESWIAVIRGLRSLHDPARFRAWVLRIVGNKSRDWIRREQARRRAVAREGAATPDVDVPSQAGDFDRVRSALTGLERGQRLILTWFYVDGMNVREIADVLDIPSGTVRSRLFHARNALRARLQEA